jgi:hypothetical protein
MKSAIALVYTGPHEEIRLIVAGREFTVERDGKPIKVDKAVALELLGRSSEEHGDHWECADEADAKDVAEHFAKLAEEAAEKAQAEKPKEKEPAEPEDANEPIDATTPKQ